MKLKSVLGITIFVSLLLVISLVCIGCQAQYETGYEEGYAVGYAEGHDEGYEGGYEFGYDVGYDVGYLEAFTEYIASMNVTEPDELSASFVITDWNQTHYDYLDEWADYVYIWYEVENTGNVDIDSYKVYFTVMCKDRSEYYESATGGDVAVGHKLSGDTLISIPGKEVTSIAINDWEIRD